VHSLLFVVDLKSKTKIPLGFMYGPGYCER
jgi:hypothetical protein